MFKRFRLVLKEPHVHLNTLSNISDSVVLLHSQQDIQQLQPALKQVLITEFNLGESASRLCPVLLEDNTVALFAVVEQSRGDAIEALAVRVLQQGYTLAQPTCYVLSIALLLELIRDPELNLNSVITLASGTNPWSQADLFNAFIDIVRWGIQHQASDIHINLLTEQEYSEVRFTIAGRYVCPLKFQGVSTQFIHDVLSVAWMNIKGGNGAVFDPYKEQQGSLQCDIDGQVVMLRWGALAAEFGPSVCLRLLQRTENDRLPTLDELGYLPAQQQLLQQTARSDGGAIVFSGAVGSGKSTTLAALVASLPSWRKVISIEDPVEYRIPNAVQVSLSRDLHHESHDAFATKLRALKRSAMSDVLLGEIRDLETGRAFTDLASSGVRLYTTVHANSAALVPARLSSDFIGVSMDLLTAPEVLRLIVHQCLLPRLCDFCAIHLLQISDFPAYIDHGYYKNLSYFRWLKTLEKHVGEQGLQRMRVRNEQGCEHCLRYGLNEFKGWNGRVVCAEILVPSRIPNFLGALYQPANLASVLHEAQWPDIRSSALLQSTLGVIDPFDIEAYFSIFSSPAWDFLFLGDAYV